MTRPRKALISLATLAKRGKGNKRQGNRKTDDCTPAKRHSAMTWAQRLKRVFNIDITTCETCGGAVKVIASIEDPAVIKQILAHLERKAESKEFNPLSESRVSGLEKTGSQKSHINFLRLINLGESHTTNFDQKVSLPKTLYALIFLTFPTAGG